MMQRLLKNWKSFVKRMKVELYALYLGYKDARTPLYARIFAACVVGYALSPIDLIPDFIPVIGYLDDLVIVPLGIWLSLKMIPATVMSESREKAQDFAKHNLPINRAIVGLIIAACLFFAILAVVFVIHVISKK
jgi:uncharacterized membrane protein YkvA (DUF1232 family)